MSVKASSARWARGMITIVSGSSEVVDSDAPPECRFCQRISEGKFIIEKPLVVVFRDSVPVSEGHLHVASRNHEASFLELSRVEREAIYDTIDEACAWISSQFSPDGFNIGINIGEAAGQTIPHASFHIIPRYAGDEDDPRGGIRRVVLDMAPYWEGRQ